LVGLRAGAGALFGCGHCRKDLGVGVSSVADDDLTQLGLLCEQAFAAADRVVSGFGRCGAQDGVDSFKAFVLAWSKFRSLIDETGCSVALSAEITTTNKVVLA